MNIKDRLHKVLSVTAARLKEAYARYQKYALLYRNNWKDYRSLFVISSAITVTVLLTVIRFFARRMLEKAGIGCLTFSTVKDVLRYPFLTLGLVALVFLLLYAAWFQYTVILTGIRNIRNDRYSLFPTFLKALKKTVRVSPAAILLFAVYIALFLPVAGLLFPTDLFSRITVPEFIINYMLTHRFWFSLLTAGAVLFLWLTLRFYYVLPLCILKDIPVSDAFSQSSEMMKGKKLRTFLRILVFVLLFWAGEWLFFLPVAGLQWVFDSYFPSLAFYSCTLAMASIKLFAAFYLIRVSILLFFSTYPESFFTLEESKESAAERSSRKNSNRLVSVISHVLSFAAALGTALVFMLGYSAGDPLVISYRGLDNNNGLPDTVEVMKKTVRTAYPDYIEIDVQETKDGQFVVLGSDVYQDYYGGKGSVRDHELAQLMALSPVSDEFPGRISSLDEYLAEAEKLNTKLILSLEYYGNEPEKMTQNFLDRFGKQISKDGCLIESNNYDVICAVIDENEKTEEAGKTASSSGYPVYYVVSVPLLYPSIDASGLNVEITNLQQSFVNSAGSHKQKLICWLAEDEKTMKQMILLNVDGISTTKPSLLRASIREVRGSGYQAVLWKYILKNLQLI